jgi:hypothetical protein
MVRPLRINHPGAYYHVTCRGNERRVRERIVMDKGLQKSVEQIDRSILSKVNRVLKNSESRLFKKVSDARRTRNRRAEAYLGATL